MSEGSDFVEAHREVVRRNRTTAAICCQCGKDASKRWVQTWSDREPTLLFCSWRCTAQYAELSTEHSLYAPPGDDR